MSTRHHTFDHLLAALAFASTVSYLLACTHLMQLLARLERLLS